MSVLVTVEKACVAERKSVTARYLNIMVVPLRENFTLKSCAETKRCGFYSGGAMMDDGDDGISTIRALLKIYL